MELKIGSVAKITHDFSAKIFNDPIKRELNDQVVITAVTDSSVTVRSVVSNEVKTLRTTDFMHAVKWFGEPRIKSVKTTKPVVVKPTSSDQNDNTSNIIESPTSDPSNITGEAEVQFYANNQFTVYYNPAGKVRFKLTTTVTSFEEPEFDPYGGTNNPYGF